MKKDLTEIIVVLDKSGSMESIVEDTISGFNTFVKEQSELPGEVLLSLVLFDTTYNFIYKETNVKAVPDLTNNIYKPSGYTALLDAMGRAIDETGNRLAATSEEHRPSNVLFVVITDGLENSSIEYTRSQIAEKVKRQTDEYSWKFMFLGANMDAIREGYSLGTTFNANFSATREGISKAYQTLSYSAQSVVVSGVLPEDWDKELTSGNNKS